MTCPGYTHLVVILDRSGSMTVIQGGTIGGFNTFLKKQKEQPGRATLSLIQFDFPTDIDCIHNFKPLQDVPDLDNGTYIPRGNTALLDAIGFTVVKEGQKLAAMKEEDRPGLVMLIIVTDGHENASREYTLPAVKALLTGQQETWKWQVTYLGANVDAFGVGASLGVARGMSANFDPTEAGAKAMFRSAAGSTTRARNAANCGLVPEDVSAAAAYSEEEREAMTEDEDKRDVQ